MGEGGEDKGDEKEEYEEDEEEKGFHERMMGEERGIEGGG